MRVPRNFVGTVGRELVYRSLQTSDYRDAIRRARIVAFEIEQMFRGGQGTGASMPQPFVPECETVSVRRQETVAPRQEAATSPQPIMPPQPVRPVQPVLTLKDIYQRFVDDPAAHRSAKTLLAYRSIYNRLAELVGESAPIASVTRDDCRRVLETLRSMPPNAVKRYGNISGKAVVERAKAEGLAPMSPTTVNLHLVVLSALFNWAENEGIISKNPARGLRVVDPVRKKDKRKPFSTEQLTGIFSAPLFRGCVDDEAGYASPGENHPRRGRFWVPLIGLFSGMRLNEICQLDVADVRTIVGIECFVVTTETAGAATGKKLKTENAERIIPVHPKLLEFGFNEHLAERRGSGQGKLFPELSLASTGYYSDNFSKWFARFLEKAGAKRPRTSFHSFRHNFRDALREARIPKDITYALGGWANENGDGDATAENYGRGYPAAALLDAIKQVEYQTLCLGHLSR
nr:site-specific integrase [uncultured Rhodoblastus sp.]